MKMFLSNHYAGSPEHGMEYRPFYLAHEWLKLGHQVTIAAASYSHLRTKPPTTTGGITVEWIEGIRYIWLATPNYQGNGIGRVLNMLTFILQLFRWRERIRQLVQPDVVIASSTYPLDIYPCRDIAKKTRARLIFEVHDLWPLSPMELGNMSSWHPFVIVMQRAENYAYRVADRVVSMLPKAEEHMRAHGMAPEKFIYVPNGISVEEWGKGSEAVPTEHEATLAKLRGAGFFTVGYAGAHGLANALETLIHAASLLRDQPVHFVLVGQGPEKKSLQQKAAQRGLSNVTFLPAVSKNAIPVLLRAMDALYVGWRRRALYRFGVSPNKLMDYMMAGKPVIHAIEAGNDMVAESGCGVSIPPEDPAAIADAVTCLMQLSQRQRAAMGSKGREYVRANHDYTALARRFLEGLSGEH